MCDWLNSFLDYYRSQKTLVLAYAHIYAIEPDFYPIAEAMIETIFQRLADRLPAFRRSFVRHWRRGDGRRQIEGFFCCRKSTNFGSRESVVRPWVLDTDKATG